MEYVEGTDLGKRVKQSGPLPVETACDYIKQAALGLQHAHERGLIHRDIKPSNLLLSAKGGVIKVLDLGLARLVRPTDEDSGQSSLTQQGSLMGTPDFIAPEQARNSHNIDARADIYSLGCTLYFLLSGQVPFPAETSTEKLYKHWVEEARPIEQLRPEVTPGLSAVIRKLMAKRPEDRFPNALTLAEALTPPYGTNVTVTAAPVTRPDVRMAPAALPLGSGTMTFANGMPAAEALPLTPMSVRLPEAVQAPAALPLGAVAAAVPVSPMPAAVPLASVALARKPPLDRRLVLGAAALGVCVLVAVPLIFLLRSSNSSSVATTGRSPTAPAGPRTREELAEAELKGLTLRFNSPEEKDDDLRRDLIAFRLKYPDLPALSVKAADLLFQVPSPFDNLQYAQIPPAEKYSALPSKTVAVLGERRWRHWGPITQVAISPDGQLIASSGYDGTRLWSAKNGREIALLDPNSNRAVTFLDKGRTLAAVSQRGETITWDLTAEDRKANTVNGTKTRIAWVTVSPDGRRVAGAQDDGGLLIWLTATGKEDGKLPGHKGKITALGFSPDGKVLASAGSDRSVRLWDVRGGKQTAAFDGLDSPVRCLAVAPDGKTVATGDDAGTISVWDADSDRPRTTLEMVHNNGVSALQWVLNGKSLVSAGNDGSVHQWDLKKKEGQELSQHAMPIEALAYSPEGQLLVSAGWDGTLRLWDLDAADEVLPPEGHIASLFGVAVSPDGQTIATASTDRTVRLWDVLRLKTREELSNHGAQVMGLAFSPDGKRLATGSWDGVVRLWDPVTGKEGEVPGGQNGSIRAVAFSPDGKFLAAGSIVDGRPQPGYLRIWDLPAKRQKALTRVQTEGVTGVAVSADSRLIATGSSDGTIRLSDPSGREQFTFDQKTPVTSVAFHPSGSPLAAGDREGHIKLWDMASKAASKPLARPNSNRVISLAFSPNGKWLASAEVGGVIILWGWTSATPLERFELPGDMRAVAFTPDGRHLVTANANGTAYILRLAGRPKR
jgi:WD40 repeat protein